MVAHNHSEHVLGCFRCDLSRDEELKEEKSVSFIEQVVEASCFNWEHSGIKDFYLGKFRIGYGLDWHNAFKLTLSHMEDGVYIGEVDSKTIPASVVAQVIDLLIKNYREA